MVSMKRFIILFFIIISFKSYGDIVNGIDYYFNEETNTATVFGNIFEHYSGDIVIPTFVENNGAKYVVKMIGGQAFKNCTGLTSIVIGDSVTTIAFSCFEGCSNLRTVRIGPNVENIYDYAFKDCTALQSISLPDKVSCLGYSVFENCTNLETVAIGDGLAKLSEYTFKNCNHLKSLTLGNGIKSMTNNSFPSSLTDVYIHDLKAWFEISFDYPSSNPLLQAKNLFLNGEKINNLIVPDDVMEIKKFAFSGFSGLESVIISESVKKIELCAFGNCDNLCSVSISDAVTSICEEAFENCISLKTLNLGNGLKYIENYAFINCPLIESIIIPNSTISIGEYAFHGCSNIMTITLGKSINFIEESAFNLNSETLEDVYCYAEHIPIAIQGAFGYTGETILHVPESSINDYKTADVWKDFKQIVAIKEGDSNPTGVISPKVEGKTEKSDYYALDGKRYSRPQQGLNIIRSNDGKVVKKKYIK